MIRRRLALVAAVAVLAAANAGCGGGVTASPSVGREVAEARAGLCELARQIESDQQAKVCP